MPYTRVFLSNFMRIKFLITDITGIGGIERVTVTVANEFIAQGHEVEIISFFKRYDTLAYTPSNNVKVHFLSSDDYDLENSTISRIRLLFKANLLLSKYLKDKDFDYIIAQAFLPAFELWCAGYIKRTIICEHFKYGLYDTAMTGFRNWIYKKACKVVTLTESDCHQFQNAGIRSVTIPNMNPFQIKANNSHGKRIIAIGRLHPQKGFDMLIAAMQKVAHQYPEWVCDIYGGGEQSDFKELIHKMKIDKNVQLKGFCTDIQSELLNSDLFVLSSRYEGLPMVMLEAMSSGVPIVSFDCPEGPAALLENEGGLLVPPEKIDKLAESIITMIGNPELRDKYRLNAYRNIEKYSPGKIYPLWARLFEEVKQ